MKAANAPFLAAAAVVLACGALAARFLSRQRRDDGLVQQESERTLLPRAVLVIGVVYFAVYSYLSIHRYNRLMCGMWDLSIFESVLANALRGEFLRDYRGPFDHLDVNLAFFLPFYSLWRDGRVLLVLQSLVLALAAWPLYLLAKEVSGRARLAAAVSIAYLLYPLLGAGNLYDFHVVCLSPLLFFSMLYVMHRRRWGPYWFLTALVLLTKETEAILVLGAGLYLLSRKDYARGAITASAAVVWVFLSTLVILPYVTGEEFRHFGRYVPSLQAARWGLETSAGIRYAILYLLRVFSVAMFALVPMGFLAARRWRPLLFVFGAPAAANMLSRDAFQQVFFGHYGLTVSTAAFGAAALALWGRGKEANAAPGSRLPVFVVATALLSNFLFSYPANERYYSPVARFDIGKSFNILSLPVPSSDVRLDFYNDLPQAKFLRAAAGLFPPGAKIAAQNNLGYLFTARNPVADLSGDVQADFYVFDLSTNDGFTIRSVYFDLFKRLFEEEGTTCFLVLGRGVPGSVVFFARGSGWMDFQANAMTAHNRDPRDPDYALAVCAVERTIGVPMTESALNAVEWGL